MLRALWGPGVAKSGDAARRSACATWLGVLLASASFGGDIADAARDGDWARVRSLAAQRSSNTQAGVNTPGPDGMTALHWAVRAGDMAATQTLLRAGANVNAASRYGVTPLSLAATNGDGGTIAVLLKAGADP